MVVVKSYFVHFSLIPREARAEGPSVARLINLSGRRPAEGRARELSRENSSRTYIYIYVCMYVCLYISVKVSAYCLATVKNKV